MNRRTPYTVQFENGMTAQWSGLKMAKLQVSQDWKRFDSLYLHCDQSASLQKEDDRIKQLEAEIAALNDEVKTEKREHQTEIDTMQKAIVDLKRKVEECQCEKLKAQNMQLQALNQDLNDQIEKLRNAPTPACDCEKLKRQNEDLNHQIENLNDEIAKLRNACDCEKLKAENKKLLDDIEKLRNAPKPACDCQKLKAENKKLLEAAQLRNSSCCASCSSGCAPRRSCSPSKKPKRDVKELEDEIVKLQKSLADKPACDCEKLKRENKQLRDEMDAKKNEIAAPLLRSAPRAAAVEQIYEAAPSVGAYALYALSAAQL